MVRIGKQKRRVVLLDTHAIIHRAYHAIPGLTGPTGEPTGALYGLVSILLKIISDLKPEYIIACADTAKPTIRHEIYEDYKGGRAKIDEALSLQLQSAHKIFEAFSIPLYAKEGFEADDLLGTIAHILKSQKNEETKDSVEIKSEDEKTGTEIITEIIIVSSDMDMLQLVAENVRVYTQKKKITDVMIYDEKAVVARFGFGPALVPDFKGLRGDPSDNIKGVPGIGEKTATELITQFGSIEDIYKELKKGGKDTSEKDASTSKGESKGENMFLKKGITKRIIGLLKEHEDDARFSKSLATIRLDAPIIFALPVREWNESVDIKKILDCFDTFGFRSLRDRARSVLDAHLVNKEVWKELERESMQEEKVDPQLVKEAQIMTWLISSDFTNPSFDDLLALTKEKVFDAARAVLEKQISDTGKLKDVYEKIEKPLIPVIQKMQERGVLIDTNILSDLSVRYHAELEGIEKNIYTFAGHEFNINSPKQLGEILFDELKITTEKIKKTAGGQRSTRESELEKMKDLHPIISPILEHRELKKLLSTYIDNLPPLLGKDGRLHAEFLQTGTTTGRMSSQNPNLQNIPHRTERGRAIRRAFIAEKGFLLVSLDYSQIELRLAALLSGDEKLCEIFKSGRDVHSEVAAQVFRVPSEKVDAEMRRRAKIINFGILYGMGVNALRVQLDSTTAEAHQYLEDYFSTFKTLSDYLERTKEFARQYNYTETLFGRRRQFPEMKSTLPYVRAQAERMAINAPIQGTQSDLIKIAMSQIDEMIKKEGKEKDAYLLLQVHDELVYEIRSECVDDLRTKIKKIMESVIESVLSPDQTKGVPILVTTKSGPNWESMTSV